MAFPSFKQPTLLSKSRFRSRSSILDVYRLSRVLHCSRPSFSESGAPTLKCSPMASIWRTVKRSDSESKSSSVMDHGNDTQLERVLSRYGMLNMPLTNMQTTGCDRPVCDLMVVAKFISFHFTYPTSRIKSMGPRARLLLGMFSRFRNRYKIPILGSICRGSGTV